MGIILPTAIAKFWDDAIGGFVWAALVARILGIMKLSEASVAKLVSESLAHYLPRQFVSVSFRHIGFSKHSGTP